METIQRRQAEALERLAGALAQGQPADSDDEAQISMRGERAGTSTAYLVIENRGPGSATIVSVESLSDANLLVEPLGLDDLTLLAGEEHRILAAPTMVTPVYSKILVTWIDGGGFQSREQAVSL